MLGRCLLGVQRYEMILKAIATDHEMAVPAERLDEGAAARTSVFARQTLGAVVGHVLGSFVAPEERLDADAAAKDRQDDNAAAWLRLRVRLAFSQDDFDRLETRLKDFVRMRNDLVHHFLATQELASAEGCRAALANLQATFEQIEGHLAEAAMWIKLLDDTKREVAQALGPDALRSLISAG